MSGHGKFVSSCKTLQSKVLSTFSCKQGHTNGSIITMKILWWNSSCNSCTANYKISCSKRLLCNNFGQGGTTCPRHDDFPNARWFLFACPALGSCSSGESNRPLTLALLKSIAIHLPFLSRYVCKSMPSSWQKVAYTPPNCITIRLPFVSQCFCRRIRVRAVGTLPRSPRTEYKIL